jgi:hypothetical protein
VKTLLRLRPLFVCLPLLRVLQQAHFSLPASLP